MDRGVINIMMKKFYNLIRALFWTDYDPNEDFVCINCSKPVFKRVLFCSYKCENDFKMEE